MVMVGADADQLEDLGRNLRQADQKLTRLALEVGGILRRTSWHGADATRFSNEWHTRLSGQLSRTADALGASGTALAREAQEQRTTSDSSGAIDSSQVGPLPRTDPLDVVHRIVEDAEKVEGPWSVLSDAREWLTEVKHVKVPTWATKAVRSVRGVPGLGLALSLDGLELDLGKNFLAGDPLSDKAVGEYAFDVASIGLSAAETALDVATVFQPEIAPDTLPASIALGTANIALGIGETDQADEMLGREVKTAVTAVGEKAGGAVLGVFHRLPTLPIVPGLPVPAGALRLAATFAH